MGSEFISDIWNLLKSYASTKDRNEVTLSFLRLLDEYGLEEEIAELIAADRNIEKNAFKLWPELEEELEEDE